MLSLRQEVDADADADAGVGYGAGPSKHQSSESELGEHHHGMCPTLSRLFEGVSLTQTGRK